MGIRRALWWLLPGLAALAMSPGPMAGEPDEKAEEKEPEKPKEKGKEPLQVRVHEGGAHVAGIRFKGQAAVGEVYEVRREGRLVAYAQVAELVKDLPRLTYLLGSGHPGDELAPVTLPVPRVQLLTDERDASEARELKALLADRLVVEELGEKTTIHKDCAARIVILHGGIFFMGGDPIAQPFAREGGTVILDTLAYSHIKGEIADETKFKEPTTLRIVRQEGFAYAFPAESRVPWYGTKKAKQFVARYMAGIPKAEGDEKLLATDHSGKNTALLDVNLGGHMAVMDLLTPTGRAGRDPGAKNKLVFLACVLGAGPRYARYMPSKPEYDDVLKWFDDLTEKHREKMAKSFEGGTDKKEDFVYSFTIGAKDKEKPLVVLGAALRGTNWLGSLALDRVAEILLENPDDDPKIPWLLDRLRIKLIPVLNPHGYRNNVDANENKVELDRNFAYHWDEYADKKARGREPFCEAGSLVIRTIFEQEKPIALLEIGVDDYEAGYRIVRARDASDAQQELLHSLITIANARLKYRFVVGDKMLQLRLTRDAERPSAANWAGSKGALAASLRICGDGEDSLANVETAIEGCLHFLYVTALSREKPEAAPKAAPDQKAPAPSLKPRPRPKRPLTKT